MHRLLENATDEQRAAIQHREGAAFVSSCPGSGKTTVITYRTAYLLDENVDPRNIVGITFTNKAANEMKERVKKLVEPQLARQVWLSTFHSFCVRLLRSNPSFYRVQRYFNIADENDSKQLVTLAMSRVTGKSERDVRSIDGTGDVQHVRKWISGYKNGLVTPEDLLAASSDDEHAVRFREFIPYYQEYQRLLRHNNLLDFDDLIMRTVLRLRTSPEEQEIFAHHLHYLMVDEWQDTNYAQFELVRLLSHMRQNVLIVGDPDQMLYSWRGASAENTARFYRSYDDVQTYFLQKNFRSVPGIAAVANQVIQNNQRQHEKFIITHKQGGELPRTTELADREHEARFVFGTIRDLVKRGARWKDFAIIYRIRAWSRALEDEAVAKNVPHRVIGALSFYNRAVVKDILSYARLLVSPHDDAAFTRIYNKPARYIGPANFSRFSAVANQHEFSLMKTLRKGLYADAVMANARQGFRQLKQLYKGLRDIGAAEVAPVVRYIVRYSGYQYYAEELKDPDRRARVLEDLAELETAAASFDEACRGKKRRGVHAFLEHAALMQQTDKDREDEDVVLLMTGHASKGLEFPNVFVCGVVEGVLPLFPRSDDGLPLTKEQVVEHYAEERRVFYVAVTRAEERLWVTYPAVRFVGNSTEPCEPSRFIQEAGDTLVFQEAQQRRDQHRPSRPTRRPRRAIPDGGADEIMRLRRSQEADDREAKRREIERRRW